MGLFEAFFFSVTDNICIWYVLGLRPRSKGRVLLKSRNPFDSPLFFPNYFADPRDVKNIVEGAQLAVRISRTPAFQRFGSRLHDIPIPGCEAHEFASDSYWECQLRHYTMLFHHQVATSQDQSLQWISYFIIHKFYSNTFIILRPWLPSFGKLKLLDY